MALHVYISPSSWTKAEAAHSRCSYVCADCKKTPNLYTPSWNKWEEIFWSTAGLVCFYRNAHPYCPHLHAPKSTEHWTDTDREGRGYKRQPIHLKRLKTSTTFSYNFIIRSQRKTLKAFCFNIMRNFGDKVEKRVKAFALASGYCGEKLWDVGCWRSL